MKRYYWPALVVLLGLLAGCGFHLRGVLSFSPELQQLYINSQNPNSTFTQTLHRLLVANKLTVTQNRHQARAILTILQMTQSKVLTSMTGSSEAGIYTLYSRVRFSVETRSGKMLIKPTTIQSNRQFNSNATQILSANTKAANLANAMQSELAQDIVNQLAKVPMPMTAS